MFNDPSVRPQTEFLCKPIRQIMEERSMTRNHEGEIIGRGIIEKGSLREASGRHLGGSRRLPDSKKYLEVIWEHLEGLRLRRHLGDIWRSDLRNRNTSQLKCKNSI